MEKTSGFSYLGILKNAWKIAWKNKYLWWYGLFVSFAGMGGMNYSFDADQGKSTASWINQEEVINFFSQNFTWIAIGALILFFLLIFFIVLGILGRGALISSIEKHTKKETSDFKSGIKEGRKFFWKILLMSIILGLFTISAFLVLVVPVIILFYNNNYIVGFLMSVFAILIFIPIILLAVYVKIYGYLYVVLGKLNFWSAIESAYSLFRKNLAKSLIMGLLFIPVVIFLAITSIMAIIPIGIISLIIGLLVYFIAGKIGAFIIFLIALIFAGLSILLLRSVYETFAQAVWVLFFHEIAKQDEKEIIVEPVPEPAPLAKTMPIIDMGKE